MAKTKPRETRRATVARRGHTEKATNTMTSKTAITEATEATEATETEAFGTAWGADGQVLSYAETTEAIAKRSGWFDRKGRWVNYARLMNEARAVLANQD